MKDIFQVIDTIQLSEKANLLSETNNEYVYKVIPSANKLKIKKRTKNSKANNWIVYIFKLQF